MIDALIVKDIFLRNNYYLHLVSTVYVFTHTKCILDRSISSPCSLDCFITYRFVMI